MKTQVIDHSGVLMQVAYEPEEPITFVSVHVLDENYRPIGPNIMPLLDGMVVMLTSKEATPFFCTLSDECMESTRIKAMQPPSA